MSDRYIFPMTRGQAEEISNIWVEMRKGAYPPAVVALLTELDGLDPRACGVFCFTNCARALEIARELDKRLYSDPLWNTLRYIDRGDAR
jgi:hypothetical protein